MREYARTVIVVRTGHKSSASRALTEEWLQHADIIGIVAQGRLGLGCFTRISWNKADPKDRRSIQRDTEGCPQGRGGNSACPGCCHKKAGQLVRGERTYEKRP